MTPLDLSMYLNMGKYGLFLLLPLLILYYLSENWAEMKKIMKCNCLLWQHPDNNDDHAPVLDLRKVDGPPGPYWSYKSLFFMPAKSIKWCYEIKKVNEDSGEVTYAVEAYLPDEHIDFESITTGGLADALDWRPAKRVLERKAPLLEKLAYGGILVMGGAALFGMMALLDMLGKGG